MAVRCVEISPLTCHPEYLLATWTTHKLLINIGLEHERGAKHRFLKEVMETLNDTLGRIARWAVLGFAQHQYYHHSATHRGCPELQKEGRRCKRCQALVLLISYAARTISGHLYVSCAFSDRRRWGNESGTATGDWRRQRATMPLSNVGQLIRPVSAASRWPRPSWAAEPRQLVHPKQASSPTIHLDECASSNASVLSNKNGSR